MNRVHGHRGGSNGARSLTYNSWRAMLSRCLNEHNWKYDLYGGAGITVCDQWKLFKNFLADMGERPSKAHTIDRIDGSGNYEPGNCRWADHFQQNANRDMEEAPF